MSTITSGRGTHAGQNELRRSWERGEALELPAARPWPQEPQVAQTRPVAASSPIVPAAPVKSVPARMNRASVRPSLVLWLVVYTLLNVGDLASTYLGLQAGLHEANPLMSGLLAQSGFGALIAYKLVVIVAVVGGAVALYRMRPRAAYITVHICNILVFLAVFLNVAQMLLPQTVLR
jgi:hypothetical protein